MLSIFLQQLKHDCGLVCIADIANRMKIDYDPYKPANTAMITDRGLSIHDMKTILGDMGLQSLALYCGIEELYTDIPLPAIILLNTHHYVVAVECNDDYIQIMDPAIGMSELSHAELKDKWYIEGYSHGILICMG